MTDLREKIARIVAPARFEGNNATFPTGQEIAFAKADAILALVRADEAAIRADERAKMSAELVSDEAVERAVDAIGGRAWSDDMRAAILAAIGEEPTT